MGDFGDKRNAEGYHDPTPYKAIKNMIKPGEIWIFHKKDNTEVEVLVVAFSDDVATILFLMDEYKDGCVEVVSNGVKYVNPRMLNWSWGSYLNKCVRKLNDQEFNTILDAIENVLVVMIGKKEVKPLHPELEAKNAELRELEQRLADMETNKAFVESCCDMIQAELNKTKAEADKYKVQFEMIKGMYDALTEKILQRA